jgi:hypothetical protein
MKPSIRFGLLSAGVTLGVYLLFYVLNKTLMVGPVAHWLTLAVVVVAMIWAVRTEREQSLKAYPFKVALKTAFIVFLITTLSFHIFYYLFFAVIDPELIDLQIQENLKWTKWLGESSLGLDPNDPAYEEFENMDHQLTISNTFFSLSRSIIGGFLIALPIAGMFKRDFSLESTPDKS